MVGTGNTPILCTEWVNHKDFIDDLLKVNMTGEKWQTNDASYGIQAICCSH
jgi:hypothetical protein